MPPDDDDDDTLSFDSTATDRTWYTSAAPPADSLSVISSDDDDDEVNEEDFLTALNSNNNSPDIPEELAKLSATPVALDDGLGPLPAIRKSSSRTPSRRASRSSRASTPAAASPNHSYNLRNRPDIFVLKHESSIFRSFIQPCMWFLMMEQVRL